MAVRQLSLKSTPLHGDDIKEVQRKLGMKGQDVDGVFGGFTAAILQEWKFTVGYPENRLNTVLGLFGRALLMGEIEFPPDYKARAEKRRGKSFVPVKNGVARPISTPTSPRSEFNVPDNEGAPGPHGKVHAAKDWFAQNGTVVRAPVTGTVVQSKKSTTNKGQVFGGVVKIRGGDGKIWVFRHVDPRGVSEGDRVARGQVVATISQWLDGPSHAHIEVWKKDEPDGYRVANMIDPMRFF
jgi:murein DD-endopeptidase MepM/ murein hydrolase activator NlpD